MVGCNLNSKLLCCHNYNDCDNYITAITTEETQLLYSVYMQFAIKTIHLNIKHNFV